MEPYFFFLIKKGLEKNKEEEKTKMKNPKTKTIKVTRTNKK